MSEWKAKRFWTKVEVVAEDGGYGVRLDGRAVKTPLKRLLVLPTREMGEAIAAEWAAVEGQINPAAMPFTRAANAAIDKVADQFDEVAGLLTAYGDSDLLCYRADTPEELAARQSESWDPILDWAADRFGARLKPRVGIMHMPQHPDCLAALEAQVRALTVFQLTGFHDLVSLSGSLVLALSVTTGQTTPELAWDLSRIDENWQIEQWGRDDEAEELAALKRDSFLHAAQFFLLS